MKKEGEGKDKMLQLGSTLKVSKEQAQSQDFSRINQVNINTQNRILHKAISMEFILTEEILLRN